MATTTITSPGDALRQIREDLGLSQSEVARRCGKSQNAFISQIENGERRLTYRTAVLIEVSLGLENDRLAGLTEDHPDRLRDTLRGSSIRDIFACRLARVTPPLLPSLAAA